MYPVLATLGSWPIATFGLFIGLSLFLGSFFIWRLVRVYDLNEEQALDLIFFTFFGGLIGARVYFVLFHLTFFLGNSSLHLGFAEQVFRILVFTRYPGLSFWGGLIAGVATLYFFIRRFNLKLWEVLDFAMVGLFIGLAVASFGCFFGGCQPGLPSSLPFAVKMAGLVGKRFPLQLVESLIFLVIFIWLWKATLRFHFEGKILSLGLIYLGIVKLLLEPWRGDQQLILPWLAAGSVFSLALIGAGTCLFYYLSERNFHTDLKLLAQIFTNSRLRNKLLLQLAKWWYNFRVGLRVGMQRWQRNLFRRLNIKSNPDQF